MSSRAPSSLDARATCARTSGQQRRAACRCPTTGVARALLCARTHARTRTWRSVCVRAHTHRHRHVSVGVALAADEHRNDLLRALTETDRATGSRPHERRLRRRGVAQCHWAPRAFSAELRGEAQRGEAPLTSCGRAAAVESLRWAAPPPPPLRDRQSERLTNWDVCERRAREKLEAD